MATSTCGSRGFGLFAAFCMLASVAHATEELNEHSIEVEWAAVYETDSQWYSLEFAKFNGSYARDEVKVVIVGTNNETLGDLVGHLEDAHERLEQGCVKVSPMSIVTVSMYSTGLSCYELHLEQRLWHSLFLINVTGSSHVAIFSNAYLSELSAAGQLLRDERGENMTAEAVYVLNASAHDDHHDDEHDHEEHDEHDHEDHDEHAEEGHDEHAEEGHDEHAEEGHDEHAEEGHDEHDHEEFDEHGHEEHDEHGHEEHIEGLDGVEDVDKKDSLGEAVGAAVVVMMITFIGVVTLAPLSRRSSKASRVWIEVLVAAFAAGALLSVTAFLLLFESTHLVESGYDEEKEAQWRWGAVILAGFLTPTVIDLFVEVVKDLLPLGRSLSRASAVRRTKIQRQNTGTDMSKEAAEDASDNKVADSSPSGVCAEAVVVTVSGVATIEPATKITETNFNGGRVRVLIGILVGDFLHNLCDGIFIGAAFAFCGSSTGWSVAISTVVHETAQEISDFMLLTSPSAGNLTPVRALALNFLSGFSTLFGVLIITYNDVSDVAVGLILVFGAGVYIYVAACECMPRVHEAAKTVTMRLGCILVFIIGAVCIALVLLDHEHCTVTGSHDGHAH